MIVIGLVGQDGVGKDTVASILKEKHYKDTAVLRAFADALREEVIEAFQLPRSTTLLSDPLLKQKPSPDLALHRCMDDGFLKAIPTPILPYGAHLTEYRTPRTIMRWWGTEYRRAQDRSYWLDRMHSFVVQALSDGKEAVILTDVRFVNESSFVTSMGGALVRVINPRVDVPPSQHASVVEQRLIPCPYLINNDSSLKQLEDKVAWVVQLIAEKQWNQE